MNFLLEDNPAKYYSLQQKFQVKVMGVSENTTEIDGVKENWYYCTFRASMWETIYGWIWGGLVDLNVKE